MKLVVRALALCLLAACVQPTVVGAQVVFSGDARFRPRLDLDDRRGDPARSYETSQFYYMYRIRLNMAALIGDGYYVRSRIGHNGVGYFQKGGEGKLPDVFGNEENEVSDEAARRTELDLMYMYLGRATEEFGFDLGLIPVPGFSNPLWDLHYYPNLLIDVPYFVWNTDGGFGGRAYADVGPGRLQVYALLDREEEESRETEDGQTLSDANDQYTFTASYALPVGGAVLEPMVMKTIPAKVEQFDADGERVRSDRYNAPLTVGARATFPALAGIVPSATLGYSWSREADTADTPVGEYTAWLARGKLAGEVGPGSLLTWADIGRRLDEAGTDEVEHEFFYLWLAYRFPVHTSELGSFAITPTWRIIDADREDRDLRRRHKIELNFDVSF